MGPVANEHHTRSRKWLVVLALGMITLGFFLYVQGKTEKEAKHRMEVAKWVTTRRNELSAGNYNTLFLLRSVIENPNSPDWQVNHARQCLEDLVKTGPALDSETMLAMLEYAKFDAKEMKFLLCVEPTDLAPTRSTSRTNELGSAESSR